MKQEDKELLLKDICARLPHGVIVYDYDKEETREMGLGTLHDIMFNDLECKPYLRPMSSMTDKEKKELELLGWRVDELADNEPWAHCGDIYHIMDGINWLLKHHFDINHLIEKGLASKANEGMYK